MVNNNPFTLSKKEEERFDRLIRAWSEDPYVMIMKDFIQHGSITTYDHCISVARCAYYLNRKLHLNADEKKLLCGAMLHDFFLYDWHGRDQGKLNRPAVLRELQARQHFPKSRITGHTLGVGPGDWTHSYKHPLIASENADRILGIPKDVRDIIETHMWPFTFWRLPQTKEAWIICMADKWASTGETLLQRKRG